jgi:hypothetical protein
MVGSGSEPLPNGPFGFYLEPWRSEYLTFNFELRDHDAYVWYPGRADRHKKLAITYEDPLPHEFFSIKCCKARRYPRLQDSSLPLFRTTTYSPLFTGMSSLIFRALTIAER